MPFFINFHLINLWKKSLFCFFFVSIHDTFGLYCTWFQEFFNDQIETNVFSNNAMNDERDTIPTLLYVRLRFMFTNLSYITGIKWIIQWNLSIFDKFFWMLNFTLRICSQINELNSVHWNPAISQKLTSLHIFCVGSKKMKPNYSNRFTSVLPIQVNLKKKNARANWHILYAFLHDVKQRPKRQQTFAKKWWKKNKNSFAEMHFELCKMQSNKMWMNRRKSSAFHQ